MLYIHAGCADISSPSVLGKHLMIRRLFKEQRCEDSLYLMFVTLQRVICDSSSAVCKNRPVKRQQTDVALDFLFVFVLYSWLIMGDLMSVWNSLQNRSFAVSWSGPKTSLNCHHFYGHPSQFQIWKLSGVLPSQRHHFGIFQRQYNRITKTQNARACSRISKDMRSCL